MPDYKNGKIYAIRSHQTEQIYIGSTTQTLPVRFGGHKRTIKCKKTCRSTLILQYDDAYIELIELFPCNTREELNKKEGEHIRTNNCVNKNIPCRTEKEYYQDNKEYFINKRKEYREENKEQEKKQLKQYYEKNRDKILEKKKQYYENKKRKTAS